MIPKGWKKCFGNLLCEDIVKTFQDASIPLENFLILDVKEKFGKLCLYYQVDSVEPLQELDDIIDKYSYLSGHICVMCGHVDVPFYRVGWASSYCDDCARKVYDGPLKSLQMKTEGLQNQFTKTSYHNYQKVERTLDITDILERIDERFKY